ncbi:SigB/SigF/SigG family RNA polymerase sigma factor [Baekduia sp. Peel2402]|uniref:SigB/SigF/SigG family RNA polymerase sigma factor n=1 Tax=Baekduia sp. Peel2402 TaxID=3458296 RepID=UPI00403E6447
MQAPRHDDLLLSRYAASHSPELREQLVLRYLPLARYCANQFARPSEPFDDLLQVASLGLIKALERYDPARGVSFSSYALPTMKGELRRYFRDRGWTVRPPRDLQEHALATERATATLIADLGRSPTIAEIAEQAGLSCEAVLDAREALAARVGTSLSAPINVAEGDGHALVDTIGFVDDGFETVEQRATIDALTRILTLREREILWLRFAEDLTQSEIGAAVGLSQMHVSRVLRAVMDKLRNAAAATPLPARGPALSDPCTLARAGRVMPGA